MPIRFFQFLKFGAKKLNDHGDLNMKTSMKNMKEKLYKIRRSKKDIALSQYQTSHNLDVRIRLHTLFSTNQYSLHQWVFDHLRARPRSTILELGSGTGKLWQENIKRIPLGWNITLSDFSQGMLKQCQKNLAEKAKLFQFIVIDAQSIPYPDNTFDRVIANHMLYHVSDRKKALREISRVLKPKGILLATTNGEENLKELVNLRRKFRLQDEINDDSFSLENGGRQLSKYFRKVKLLRYQDSFKVTKVDPLVDYICSGIRVAPKNIGSLKAFLKRKISEKGHFFIQKHAGLFIAQK